MEDAKAKISEELFYHNDKEDGLRLIPDLKEILPLEVYTTFELIAKDYAAIQIAATTESEEKNRRESALTSVPWENLKQNLPSDSFFKDSVVLTVIALGAAYTTIEGRKEVMGKINHYQLANEFNADTSSSSNQNKKQRVELGPSDLIIDN